MHKYGSPEPIKPVTETEETDPQGISTTAAAQETQTWSPEDGAELAQENRDTDQG